MGKCNFNVNSAPLTVQTKSVIDCGNGITIQFGEGDRPVDISDAWNTIASAVNMLSNIKLEE